VDLARRIIILVRGEDCYLAAFGCSSDFAKLGIAVFGQRGNAVVESRAGNAAVKFRRQVI
jgi:hypothetical protein